MGCENSTAASTLAPRRSEKKSARSRSGRRLKNRRSTTRSSVKNNSVKSGGSSADNKAASEDAFNDVLSADLPVDVQDPEVKVPQKEEEPKKQQAAAEGSTTVDTISLLNQLQVGGVPAAPMTREEGNVPELPAPTSTIPNPLAGRVNQGEAAVPAAPQSSALKAEVSSWMESLSSSGSGAKTLTSNPASMELSSDNMSSSEEEQCKSSPTTQNKVNQKPLSGFQVFATAQEASQSEFDGTEMSGVPRSLVSGVAITEPEDPTWWECHIDPRVAASHAKQDEAARRKRDESRTTTGGAHSATDNAAKSQKSAALNSMILAWKADITSPSSVTLTE